jgi:hypothetical protein
MCGALPVTYLFSRACPSHEEGLALLREAAARAGRPLELTVREIRDDEQAERERFPGSPTYLVHGRDAFAVEQQVPFRADSCRVYRRRGDRFGPLPRLEDLAAALAGAAGEPRLG